jgi:predicted DsbA family dithiol-disulfide isomerase
MCPFCYIGKRKFETALTQFQHKENIHIIWKSYQLSPDMKTDPTVNIHEFLAKHKGFSVQEAKEVNEHVAHLAEQVGLKFNFDKSVVANSFNAHRFAHFAKSFGKQNEAEEKLFYAYFTDGKNIDDYPTLIQIGAEIGLDTSELQQALDSGMYADDVKTDMQEARQIGVRGVPFFVFNRKYAVSGAQNVQTFLETLESSVREWKKDNS